MTDNKFDTDKDIIAFAKRLFLKDRIGVQVRGEQCGRHGGEVV